MTPDIVIGDWVLYKDENDQEHVSPVVHVDADGAIYTKHTGPYWLGRYEILEVRHTPQEDAP